MIIGILSDTHLNMVTEQFVSQCEQAFARCEMILHAGDLTNLAVLSVFEPKVVHAVSGNMCNHITTQTLASDKRISVEGFQIGLTHGAGLCHNIEDRVFEIFPDVDCIVFGHTHVPLCRYYGNTLMINPGSFQSTGPYGSGASYATLEITKEGIKGSLHSLDSLVI